MFKFLKKKKKIKNKIQIVTEKTGLQSIGMGAIAFGITTFPYCDSLFTCSRTFVLIAVGVGLIAFKYKLEHNSRWS